MPETERPFTAVPKPERDEAGVGEAVAKRGWLDFADGAMGILFLLVLSSFCGALIAVYWPFSPAGGETAVSDRLSTLEAKIDQIAVGHASRVASQAFAGQRRETMTLKNRLDADEARLAAMEKSQSAAETVDLNGVKTSSEQNASDVKRIADRLASLEQTVGPAGAQALARLRNDFDDRTEALHDQISRSEARIAQLERSAPPAGLAQRLDSFALKSEEGALETRILQLETQDMSGVMRRAAAVMALADLVRASAGNEPFADELAALKTLAPASPEIQDLARYAAKGVPTRTMLADSFSRQADAILATQRTGPSKTWSDRIWSSMINVVSVHPTGNILGNDSQAHVARAEVDLNLGELARAIHEVNALPPGAAHDAAAPWLKSANERMNVDRDARMLAQRLVADLSVQPAAAQTLRAAAPSR
jgi:hypothetical protein